MSYAAKEVRTRHLMVLWDEKDSNNSFWFSMMWNDSLALDHVVCSIKVRARHQLNAQFQLWTYGSARAIWSEDKTLEQWQLQLCGFLAYCTFNGSFCYFMICDSIL